ncbi:hypothetical protein [Methanogenium sp. MK-MG]|uniref:hypothetical protein n=1 Tax=Methanogenium sp. MK-MG TaxID=2599926 RepID=UPI0013EA6D97|nr:hypothetical protein [Methanogenium sp. MK-MG]
MRPKDILKARLETENPGVSGLSESNIKRKLRRLTKSNKIVKIKPDEFSKFGIDDSDQKATYYISEENYELKAHFDEILPYLSSKDESKIKTTINEIDLYNDFYFLDPKQLDKVVLALDNNADIVKHSLIVLDNNIIKRGVKPWNTEELLEKLKDVIKRFRDEDNSQIIQLTIALLGNYNDYAVIEQLKHDAQDFERISQHYTHYTSDQTAEVIDKYRTDLFYLENELYQRNKEKNAEFVREIRKISVKKIKEKREIK